jgi:hypothetical protein
MDVLLPCRHVPALYPQSTHASVLE